MAKVSRIDANLEWFKKQASLAISLRDLRDRLGYKDSPGVHALLKRKLKKYEIDDTHLKTKTKGLTRETSPDIEARSKRAEKSFDECFKIGSAISNMKLFVRLMRLGIKQYQCESCKKCEWNDLPIPLQVHHKNSINNDNRVENLEILCSNCHDSFHGYALNAARIAGRLGILDEKLINQALFCGKLKTPAEIQRTVPGICERCEKNFIGYPDQRFCTVLCSNTFRCKDRPSKEEIEQMLKDEQSWASLARRYGVSDSSVKKWAKQYGIVIPERCCKRIPERACEQCGNNYKPKDADQKYCCPACQRISQRKVKRPSLEDLKVLMQTQSYRSIGEKYGAGHKTVVGWAKSYGIYVPRRKVSWVPVQKEASSGD